MYQLKFNNDIIYDPRGVNEIDKLIIRDPSIELAVGRAGSVKFTIGNDHPLLSRLTRMHGILELLDDGEPIFRGRIIRDTKTFRLDREIEAEGVLACLNDSIIQPYSFPEDFASNSAYNAAAASGNVIRFWLSWLLDNHNAQVGNEQKIKLGNVTVTDPNNYITRSNEKYSNTWSTISEKLSGSSLGGYLLIRYENDGNYLDYLSDFPSTNIQKVEFAQNLLDLIVETYGDEIFTAILPVGKDGLTIASLPDGTISGTLVKSGKIIYDSAAESVYGRITKVVEWDDVTEAANLRTKAAAELQSGISMPETIECKACDLHGIDGSIPSFRIGRYVNALSRPHGMDALYPLMELKPDIFHPGNTGVVMGRMARTLTSELIATAENAQSTSQETAKIVNALSENMGAYIIIANSAQSTAKSAHSTATATATQLTGAEASIAELQSDMAELKTRVQNVENILANNNLS